MEMSITIVDDGGRNGSSSSGYLHGVSCVSIVNVESPEKFAGDQRFLAGRENREEAELCSFSSSSSSIGKNSDISEGSFSKSEADSGRTEEDEAQSSYKGPLHAMGALEEVLPIRRGISKFYDGKSKSFASLAYASSLSSVKNIVKPENAYSRRRRNMLASGLPGDKNKTLQVKSYGGGISKKLSNSNRTTLALAVTMTRYESNNSGEESNLRPKLIPKFPPSWRSFSLADLQQCTSSKASCKLDSPILGKDPVENLT